MKSWIVTGVCMCSLFAAGRSAVAASVPVAGFSFEAPVLITDGTIGATPTGWTSSGGTLGVYNPSGIFQNDVDTGASLGSLTSAGGDGKQVLYDNGGYVYQDVGALTANTTYTLTVAIGLPSNSSNQTISDPQLRGNTGSGTGIGTVLSENNVLNNSVAAGTLKDFTVTYTTGSSVTGDLVILLNTGGAQSLFDNVRLTSVPEPSLFALAGVGGLGLLCYRRRHSA